MTLIAPYLLHPQLLQWFKMKIYKVSYYTDLGGYGTNWYSNKRDAEKFDKAYTGASEEIQSCGVDVVIFKPTKKGILRLLNATTVASE